MPADLSDLPFDDASDVGSIQLRLHPIDVGFDLREQDMTVEVGTDWPLRVSYPDENNARRVMTGSPAAVIERLRALGFNVVQVGVMMPERDNRGTVLDFRGLEIVSGEGDGPGTVELYDGPPTATALRNRLQYERSRDDRWAFARTPGNPDRYAI